VREELLAARRVACDLEERRHRSEADAAGNADKGLRARRQWAQSMAHRRQ